jgi:hypothetical protein
MGKISHLGGLICKYVFPTGQIVDMGGGDRRLYGFEWKSTYDQALRYKKAPPGFPGNGKYFIPKAPPDAPRVLDSYFTVR